MKKMCLMVVAAVAACGVRADVKLAAPFNDGMVLQREKPVGDRGVRRAVGPAFGQLGPTANCGFLPTPLKWWYCFAMLAGRLEIYTLLIMIGRICHVKSVN